MMGGIDWAYPQREAAGHRVEAAVAERVATQQTPGGEEEAAGDPKALDRLDGVARTGRLVAAAAGTGRGDPASVGADRSQNDPFHVERPPAGVPAKASSRLLATPGLPSRSTRSPISERATMTKS